MDERTKAEIDQSIKRIISIYEKVMKDEFDKIDSNEINQEKEYLEGIQEKLEKELEGLYDAGKNRIDPEVGQLENQITEIKDYVESFIPDLLLSIGMPEELPKTVDEELPEENIDDQTDETEMYDDISQEIDSETELPEHEETIEEPQAAYDDHMLDTVVSDEIITPEELEEVAPVEEEKNRIEKTDHTIQLNQNVEEEYQTMAEKIVNSRSSDIKTLSQLANTAKSVLEQIGQELVSKKTENIEIDNNKNHSDYIQE